MFVVGSRSPWDFVRTQASWRRCKKVLSSAEGRDSAFAHNAGDLEPSRVGTSHDGDEGRHRMATDHLAQVQVHIGIADVAYRYSTVARID